MNQLILKKIFQISFLFLINFSITTAGTQQNGISFWNENQRGANVFNKKITREDIRAAKAYGFTFIRLAPDKFITSKRDFLLGNADSYAGFISEDLEVLKNILDICDEEKMPVVITMLSLPGSRWKQNNKDRDDLRIWTDAKFQQQAAKFWHDLAEALKDHPAVVGYNILNEPHPERLQDPDGNHSHQVDQEKVQEQLYHLYHMVINSIRTVDQKTPIILEGSGYGDAKMFEDLKLHEDSAIIYSFHMYEPYAYTNLKTNKGAFRYPGKIKGQFWEKETLRDYMQTVVQFQEVHHIPSNRILVGEFGGHRSSKGLPQYFEDLISIFKENGWHYAFYAFREDTWDGMDYELGDKKLPASYWKEMDQGKVPKLNRMGDSPQFKVLRELK